MNKINIVSIILYALAVVCFFGYILTKESELMAGGGLLMIGGGIALICSKKEK